MIFSTFESKEKSQFSAWSCWNSFLDSLSSIHRPTLSLFQQDPPSKGWDRGTECEHGLENCYCGSLNPRDLGFKVDCCCRQFSQMNNSDLLIIETNNFAMKFQQ